ncbi:MAG TPA: molybdopterin-dependent oxidoreductase [Methylomirabilota bacterium]|nr:molybdopterin-dependent oxidoreductase [Methylomirabilota bacterium]
MPKLTIDGKEIEVEGGTNLVEAARRLGIEVPHYCYHPGLSIAGQCRLCMVDIEKTPRPTIACNTTATDGMVVHTDTERVRETRRSIMEFHLINHPLDCPVCDQAGECWLQIYYMKYGLYDPRMKDEKVHKAKAVPLGPHVMLDAERCILCSRCVRFCDEITGTGELGIFNRGDHSEIGLFPGHDLTNNYSANVVDICPVGALTDRGFRFQVRVWYLDAARSVCTGCARGCNIDVHVNRRRPHHAEGKRVARLKPRYNAEVNAWWLCDLGRYHYDFVDAPTRLTTPLRRNASGVNDVSWDDAIAGVGDALRRYPPDAVGVLASPRLPNEDLLALKRVLEARAIKQVAFDVPPATPAQGDDFLLRADRTPNRRGAELIGLAGDAGNVLAAARAGRLKCLWVFGHDLLASGWPAAEVTEALGKVETVIFAGTNANATSERGHWVLPLATWVERDGTYTNFEGRVQRFRTAVDPVGQALPAWDVLGRVLTAVGGTPAGSRAEHWFRELARAVPAFAGLSYQSIGDHGQMIAGATSSGVPTPPGRRAKAHA